MDWKLKFVYSPTEKKLYKISHEGGKIKKTITEPLKSNMGNLLALHTANTPNGVYAVQEFVKGVALSVKGKDGNLKKIGEYPTREAAQQAAESDAGLGQEQPEGGETISDPKHFHPHSKSVELQTKHQNVGSEPSTGEVPTSEPTQSQKIAAAKVGGGEDTKGGTGKKQAPGLPPEGSTHEPGADIAPAAAGFRSAIERVKTDLLGFLDKYDTQLGDGKDTENISPIRLRNEIEGLDKLRSEQLSTRVNTISQTFHDIFTSVRRTIAKGVEKQQWEKSFPQYAKASSTEVLSLLNKRKHSDKYDKDVEYKQRVDDEIEKIKSFYDGMKEQIKSSTRFQELDTDYQKASAAIRLAQSAGKELTTTTRGSKKADEPVGVRKQRYRKLHDPETGEEIGWKPVGSPWTAPKDPTYSLTPTYKSMAGATPAQELATTNKSLYDILKRYGNDVGMMNKQDRERFEKLKTRRAELMAPKNFVVHKKEHFEHWLDTISENAECDGVPNWYDCI